MQQQQHYFVQQRQQELLQQQHHHHHQQLQLQQQQRQERQRREQHLHGQHHHQQPEQVPGPYTSTSANGAPPFPTSAAFQPHQQAGAGPADQAGENPPHDRDVPYYYRHRDSLNYKRKSAFWQNKDKQIRDELDALDRQGPHLAATIAHGSTTTPSKWAQSGAQKRLLVLYNRRKDQLARIAVLEEENRQQQRLLFLKKEEYVRHQTEYMKRNGGSTAGGPLLKEFDTEDMRRARYSHQTKIPRSINVLQKLDHRIIQHLITGGKSVALEVLPEWLRIDLESIPTIGEAPPPESLEVYLSKVFEKNPRAPTVVAALYTPKPRAIVSLAPTSSPAAKPVSRPIPSFAPTSIPFIPSVPAAVSAPVQVPISAPAPPPSLPPPAHSAPPPPATTAVATPTTTATGSPEGTPGPSSEANKAKKLKKPSAANEPQVPAMAQHMVVQLSMSPIARCRRCNAPHPSSGGCANLECEAGIRLALDVLRSSDSDPKKKQAMRKNLVAKLGDMTSSKKQ